MQTVTDLFTNIQTYYDKTNNTTTKHTQHIHSFPT